SDDQVWTWSDHVSILSADPVNKQKTVVKAPGTIKSYSQLNSTTKSGKAVTFGPFTKDSPELKNAQMAQVRFLDNSEQLEALEHRREYFVSHWANDLNVLEHYALRNRAPAISDGFDKVKQTVSRFMKARDNFIKTLLVKVPVDARQMYVVDEIGNVSTSAVTRPQRVDGERFKVMQLKPRYPMAGQWNYTWWHGYSVPLSSYLRVQGTRHALRVPFIGSITGSASQSNEIPVAAIKTRNTAVSRYQLRVTLPEGATNIHAHVPFAVDGLRMERQHYYFDLQGRTVVVIEHHNVAPSAADAHVVVTYDYSRWALWQKPAVVALVLFVLFAMASVVNRMQHGCLVQSTLASTAAPTKCTISLPFGTIVLTHLPAFVPSQLCAKHTKTPLPPNTKPLTSMSICDATGSEFLPDNCIPSPTTSEGQSSQEDQGASQDMDSLEPAHMRLHVMPTPTNILIKRDIASSDASESEWPSSSAEISSHEDLLSEDELAWSGIDNDGLGNLFAGMLQSSGKKESQGNAGSASDKEMPGMESLSASNKDSSSLWLWDIGTATSAEASPMQSEPQSQPAEPVFAIGWGSSSSESISQETSGHTESSIKRESSPLSEPSSSSQEASVSSEPSSNQEASTSSESAIQEASSHTESSIKLESSSLSEPSSSSQEASTYSEISSKAFAQDSDSHEAEPSSAFPQSTLISVIEETNAAPFQGIDSTPMGVAGVREECAVGSFRCTDDRRGFDTCVYGRWGTIRMCSQGTSCIPVDGGTIACA
ncbi:dolichyl-diphosphooligosaccharide--protein glycosyltransferase subunit 1, partial [Coemansia sp. RSA 1290]